MRKFESLQKDESRAQSADFSKTNSRGREPMAHKPDVALLMKASGLLDIFLT